MKGMVMKKILVVLMAHGLLVVLSGCYSNSVPETSCSGYCPMLRQKVGMPMLNDINNTSTAAMMRKTDSMKFFYDNHCR